MSLRRLLSAANQTAETADSLSATFARALAHVLRETERGLRPLLEDAADGSRTAIVKASHANRTRQAIRDVLLEAGFDALAERATGDVLDEMISAVLGRRRLTARAATLTPSTTIRIAALKVLQFDDLLDEGDQLAKALWQATLRGVFASRSVPDILADLADVLDSTEPQIRTLYDTSVSIFGRQVEALQAGDDPETIFAFMGPADKKNREFCRAHVGKVYTREEIDAMDNGQLDNVFLTGGGYNCRHQWVEVSKFSELQDLVGTDQRIPEVQEQIADLPEAA